jgi:hypothetical protein
VEIEEALSKAAETTGFTTDVPETTATPAPTVVETTSTPAPEAASTRTAAERARDELGRFAPKTGDDKPAEKPAAAPKGDANGAAAAAPPAGEAKAGGADSPAAPPAAAVPEKPVETVRPPVSWKPAAREAFAKAPPEVQAEVIRREHEITKRLNEVAEPVKLAERFRQVVAPFEQSMRSKGVDPLQVFANTLPTIQALESPHPGQRAQVIAQIIRAYLPGEQGIDLLAQTLDGKAGLAQAPVDPVAIAAQAEQRVFQRLQAQAATVAAQRQEAMLSKFATERPFFEDVRTKMGDILAARGTPNPSEQELAEVYDLACNLDPEISRILKQREAAKAVPTSIEATARARAAASSVRSTPAAPPSRGTQPQTIDDAFEMAKAKLAGR